MKNVTIYTTPTCHFCHAAKAYFKENKVEFTEKDVTTDPSFQQEAMSKSGQMGVPVIDIDGEVIVGFNRVKLGELLSIS